jgi:AraC-like DNA-binding protein
MTDHAFLNKAFYTHKSAIPKTTMAEKKKYCHINTVNLLTIFSETVAEIDYRLNFEESSYLGRLFKFETGVRPLPSANKCASTLSLPRNNNLLKNPKPSPLLTGCLH